MDRPEDQADLGSTLRPRDRQVPETEEHDWWQVENQLERKQVRSRAYQEIDRETYRETYRETNQQIKAKGPEKPRKRGKAHNRRGPNDYGEGP
jgi:hypothetical protein